MTYSEMTHSQKLVVRFIGKKEHSLHGGMDQIFDLKNWCSRYVYRTEEGRLTLQRTPFSFKYQQLVAGKHKGIAV